VQLGLVTAVLGDLDLPGVAGVAAEEGYACLEIQCWPVDGPFAGVCHLNVEGLGRASAEQAQKICRDRGIEIASLGYYPNAMSASEDEAIAAREHLCKVIDAAVLLDVPVNTFIGADHTATIDENFERFLHVWPPLIDFAEQRRVNICIENCPMRFFGKTWPTGGNMAQSPDIWRRMFEAIDSPRFGLNYDPSHLIWQMIDPVEPIYEFRDKILQVHAKDTSIDGSLLAQRGILADGWHRAKVPGLGEMDWSCFFSALSDIRYDGPVSVEIEDDAFTGELPRRRQALRIAKNVLLPYIA